MPTARSQSRTTNSRTRSRRRGTRRRRRILPWLILGVVALVGFLYSRPLGTYVDRRAELDRRGAEVAALRQRQTELRLTLASAGNLTQLEREARRIGLVRPNERLFIVKGISAWRRSTAARRAP